MASLPSKEQSQTLDHAELASGRSHSRFKASTQHSPPCIMLVTAIIWAVLCSCTWAFPHLQLASTCKCRINVTMLVNPVLHLLHINQLHGKQPCISAKLPHLLESPAVKNVAAKVEHQLNRKKNTGTHSGSFCITNTQILQRIKISFPWGDGHKGASCHAPPVCRLESPHNIYGAVSFWDENVRQLHWHPRCHTTDALLMPSLPGDPLNMHMPNSAVPGPSFP